MAIFINITANFNTQSIEVTESPISLGRSSSSDIKLEDNMVSGQHVRFFLHDGKIYAEDLDTTNGSFINGKAFNKTIFTLKDEIKIGEILITLDKSKMTVKEIFSHKGATSPAETETAGDSKNALPDKNQTEKIDDDQSLSGIIRNAKVQQGKEKPSENIAKKTILPKFISEDEENEKKENLADKLKNLFKKK